jgi:hypothetical protein
MGEVLVDKYSPYYPCSPRCSPTGGTVHIDVNNQVCPCDNFVGASTLEGCHVPFSGLSRAHRCRQPGEVVIGDVLIHKYSRYYSFSPCCCPTGGGVHTGV